MVAADTQSDRSKATTVPALRVALFDDLAEQRGATNEVERARLVGIDRTTLYRLKARKFTASLEVAMRMAERLGTTVDELFEQVAA